MITSQERMQILKMIESARITAEEGAKLLGAIEETTVRERSGAGEAPPRWFRIRVADLRTGKNKVEVNIPLALIEVGMRMGARFAPQMGDIDLGEVSEAISQGIQGKIIDVEDQEEGEHVSIYVE